MRLSKAVKSVVKSRPASPLLIQLISGVPYDEDDLLSRLTSPSYIGRPSATSALIWQSVIWSALVKSHQSLLSNRPTPSVDDAEISPEKLVTWDCVLVYASFIHEHNAPYLESLLRTCAQLRGFHQWGWCNQSLSVLQQKSFPSPDGIPNLPLKYAAWKLTKSSNCPEAHA